MLKRLSMTVAALVCLAVPALADVAIEDVLVRKKGPDVNVRVTVRNPGKATQAGPVKVTLYIRPDSSAEWQKIKTWTDISKLQAGNRVSRDFFEENNATLRKIAENPHFEVKASVEAPGVPKQVEKTSVYGDSETGH